MKQGENFIIKPATTIWNIPFKTFLQGLYQTAWEVSPLSLPYSSCSVSLPSPFPLLKQSNSTQAPNLPITPGSWQGKRSHIEKREDSFFPPYYYFIFMAL